MKKRILSIILCAILVAGALPVLNAAAADAASELANDLFNPQGEFTLTMHGRSQIHFVNITNEAKFRAWLAVGAWRQRGLSCRY